MSTEVTRAKFANASARTQTVTVVGTGTMGTQIACLAALSGFQVALAGRSHKRLQQAGDAIAALVSRKVTKGSLSADKGRTATQAVTYSDDLARAVEDADLIIESVAEDREVKADVLATICRRARGDAVIGTNSSTIGSSAFAEVVTNPARLLNVHFYNPPLIMRLVEVVRGDHTDDASVNVAMQFARALGKTPVLVQKEEFGFLANRMLFSAIAESMRLTADGYVSSADCDVAVTHALGWPLGPFAISDLVGLDVVECILDEGVAQTADSHWEPSSELRALVRRGDLGRKTGRGFASYEKR